MSLLRERYQHKRYRLKGYTTPSRVKAKYKQVTFKQYAVHFVSLLLIVVLLIAFWVVVEPVSVISELIKTLGY